MSPLLTDTFIESVQPADRAVILYDSRLPGYGLKVTPTGRRQLLVMFWSPVDRGRRRRYYIGQVGDPIAMPDGTTARLTAFTGRKLAQVIRGKVNAGRDPFSERLLEVERAAEHERTAAHQAALARSVSEVVTEFLTDAEARDLRPRTLKEWKRLLEKHVIPIIGDRSIGEVGKADAQLVRRAMPHGRHVLANRVQQVCCALLNFAEDDRIGLKNPFALGKRGSQRWHKEELTREPFTREELGRLFAALDEEDDGKRGGAVDAIRFLALTGWRKSEGMSLRWDAVDFETAEATLRDTKTGRSSRALSPEALALLAAIPRAGPFVFPSPANRRAHRTEAKRTWLRVREAAGLTKPLHSLRHAAATIALSEGVPLATVGAILGHKDPATTLRYAKTEHDAARGGAAVMGSAIARATAPPEVTPISARRRSRR